MVSFKVFFGSETRRLNLDQQELDYETLLNVVSDLFKLPANTLLLKYVDDEGDKVTIACDEDLEDGLVLFEKSEGKTFKLFLSNVAKPNPISKKDDGFVILREPVAEEVKSERVDASAVLNESVVVGAAGKSAPQPSVNIVPVLGAAAPTPASAPKPQQAKKTDPSVEQILAAIEQLKSKNDAELIQKLKETLNKSPDPADEKVALPQQSEEENNSVHTNVRCDVCNMSPILGVRFKCTVCMNFDLCSKCEKSNIHSADHPLLKIKVPREISDPSSGMDIPSPFQIFKIPVSSGAPQSAGSSMHGVSPNRKSGGRVKNFAKFIGDMTIPDRSYVAPGDLKEKVWKLQNVGKFAWPAGFKVVMLPGSEKIIAPEFRSIVLGEIQPNETFEIKVQVQVPREAGRYVAYFRLVNSEDEKFGPRFWVDFYVPQLDAADKKEAVEVIKPIPLNAAAAAAPVEPEQAPLVPLVSEEEIKYHIQLKELSSMGFDDTKLNIYLLNKFEGNSVRVVNWLLDQARSK